MNRISLLVLAALLLGPPSLSAGRVGPSTIDPPTGAVTGQVVDRSTGDPVASATVALWNASDSTLVTGGISDPSGVFRLERVRQGSYYVQVSFVGLHSKSIESVVIEPGALAVNLGTIALSPDTAVLGEVEVTAERNFVEVGIDRTVYNTRDQIVSAGGSASDVLQNIPSVEVDLNGNVSLRGNQNVAILINGRPSPVQGSALASFLQGLPGNSVERVEVIPNPSAKYEPDGMAGILNIVLKKDVDLGLNGAFTAGIGSNDSYNASGNVNLSRGRVSLFSNYGFRYDTRSRSGVMFRENRFADPLTTLNQTEAEDRTSFSHVLNSSVDVSLGEAGTLSASSLLSTRPSEQNELMDFLTSGVSADPLDRFDRNAFSRSSGLNTDHSVAFRRAGETSRDELTVELRYNTNTNNDDATFTEQDRLLPDLALREIQRNDVDDLRKEGAVQIDYARPIFGAKLETGYKGSFRRMDSRFYSESSDGSSDLFAPDIDLNNAFVYDDRVQAVYGTLGGDLGRFGLQAGVRLEQADTRFDLRTTQERFNNDYFSAFPSAFLTYRLTPKRQVKASYSKRINRPGTWSLNPFASQEDPLNRRVGNPYLKPEYVHAFEASVTQFTGATSMTVSPYFRRTVDEIRRYLTVDDQGVSTLTFENFDTSDSYGLEAIGTLQLKGRLNAYASFNAYRVVTDGSNVEANLTNEAFGWTTRMNATLTLIPSLDLQVSYFYRAPMNIERGRIGAFSMTNVALRQKLLNNRADLSLRLSDPFQQSGFNLWRGDERFYVRMDRRWESRVALATFTYNFGERKAGQNRRRPNREQVDDRVDIDF